MILLNPAEYYKVAESLHQVEINHLFARTVVEQKMDGTVYVDDVHQPSVFYVKHAYGMALLWGNHQNDAFNEKLKSYLLNESKSREKGEWLQVFPEAWSDKLEELLGHQLAKGRSNEGQTFVSQSTRVNFRFNRAKYQPLKADGLTELKPVRTANGLFHKMKGTVIPSCFWRNEAEFVRHGVGFSLVSDGEPVSTAFSAFMHKPMLELGIETRPQFYGKGLAQITCSALIDYCLEEELEPVWACRLENAGSYKLAQKLGFDVERMIPYYQLPI